MKSEKRLVEFDLMKVILIFFVLFGHIVIQQVTDNYTGGGGIYLMTYFGTPVCQMLSPTLSFCGLVFLPISFT